MNVLLVPIFLKMNILLLSVTAKRYNYTLSTFFIPKLQRLDLTHVLRQQDGATSHTVWLIMTILQEQFPGSLISRFSDIHWPIRSVDLIPIDYFLWRYFKEKACTGKPWTAVELKQNIRWDILVIPIDMLSNVVSWIERERERERNPECSVVMKNIKGMFYSSLFWWTLLF